jgi:hypothetical protein
MLDEGVTGMLLAAIRAGNRLSVAARLAGLSPSTVEEWMRRGRGTDARPATPAHVRFVEAVEVAEAAAEADLLAAVQGATPRDWRAAAWLLANRSPDWRRNRLTPDEPPPPLPRPTSQLGPVRHIPAKVLEGVATYALAKEAGDTLEDRADRLRALARLVDGP